VRREEFQVGGWRSNETRTYASLAPRCDWMMAPSAFAYHQHNSRARHLCFTYKVWICSMTRWDSQATILFTMYGRRISAYSFDEDIVPVCYICTEYITQPDVPYTECTPRYVKKAYEDQTPADQLRNWRNWEWFRYYRASEFCEQIHSIKIANRRAQFCCTRNRTSANSQAHRTGIGPGEKTQNHPFSRSPGMKRQLRVSLEK
jgi:hypothetical protein